MIEGAARCAIGRIGAGFVHCLLGIGWLALGTTPASALEALDGKIQAHGFAEMQIRGISEKYGTEGNVLDLAQWYNVINLEVELDILDETWGPLDLLSAFVRVEGRYDCIYTHGCTMIRGADTFGNSHRRLPKRLRDAEDPDYTGVIEVGPPVKRIQNKKAARMGGERFTEPFGGGELNLLVLDDPEGPIIEDGITVRVTDPAGTIRRDVFVVEDPFGDILRDLTDDGMVNPMLYSYDPTQSSGLLAPNVGFSRSATGTIILDDIHFTGQSYYRGWRYPDDTMTIPNIGDGNPAVGQQNCDPNLGCPGEAGSLVPPEINPIYVQSIIERVGFPGFDTFNSIAGADAIPGTADDPAIYLLGDFADYRFGLKDIRGPAGGAGTTQIIGPWLPENTVHSLAQASHLANPLRGVTTPALYTDSGNFRSRRFYDLSEDLMDGSFGLGNSPAEMLRKEQLKKLLWNDPTDVSAGFTDLVDTTPESLRSLLLPGAFVPFNFNNSLSASTDFYATAPKDNAWFLANAPFGAPYTKFGGDYSGIIPCTITDRTAKGLRTSAQNQYTGVNHNSGCISFTNIRVTGGVGELPLRPAPDRSNVYEDFDLRYAQGLYIPSAGLLKYMDDGGDWDKSGFNISEKRRSWNRGYSQEDNKELKEAFIDAEFFDSRLWVRLGLQNIVWGKTELFRTTDQFNPQDFALAGVLAGLEESRIALWSARFVYSLYDVGPLEDVRLEFAMNLDDFEPIDLGACGEPFTINVVCSITTGIWAHGTLGVGIAGVDRPPNFWNDIDGLEFGGRVEWRWDRFSFALTDFLGYNDLPYADAIFYYDRGVEAGLANAATREFVMGAGRPLAAGYSTGCSGLADQSGEGLWASANRSSKSYQSMTLMGVGRDPACLKPGGAAGGLNQNGFTVQRDMDGNVIYARVDDTGNPRYDESLGSATPWVFDGTNRYPSTISPLVPILCSTPDEFADCEPLRYEVGLAEDTFNGNLFKDGLSPENALENHTANQQSFAWICTATLTIGASLDPSACAFTLFGTPNFLARGFVDIVGSEVISCLMAGEPGSACTGIMSVISGALAGVPATRSAHLVALNRDPNDGLITANVPREELKIFANRDGPDLSVPGSFSSAAASLGRFYFDPVAMVNVNRLGAGNIFLPGDEDMLTLDSTLTVEQRALLGCGPFYGTRCDTSIQTKGPCEYLGVGCTTGGGLDFLNMEASVLVQSFVGIEGTDLTDPMYTANPEHPEWAQWAAGGENFAGTAYAQSGLWLTTSGLPQPGTMEFAGGPICTRYSEELDDTVVLPGCRGINGVVTRDLDELNDPIANPDHVVTFYFDDGYDPRVDGCVLGESIYGFNVRGIYRNGDPVNLNPCFETDDPARDPDVAFSTRKSGYYYVWPIGKSDADFPNLFPTPSLVDWNRTAPSLSPTSRNGSGTLWHPYAGCFLDPADAIAGRECVSVSKNNIDELRQRAMGGDIFAFFLTLRLARGGQGVLFPGEEPRDFEEAFFIPGDQIINMGGQTGYGFNLQSQIFRSELAAFSWNFMMFLVQASCDKNEDNIAEDPECFDPRRQFAFAKCSYANPQLCTNVKGFFGAAGVLRNTVRAGGNERFGRRVFLWHSGGELNLSYNKRNVMGFSMDFGEDTTKSNWGVEFTWISKQYFFNNDDFDDNVTKSDVLNLTISVDRPTFINFLNQNRTFFINSQWFFQYITDYEDGFATTGPVNVLFTVAAFTGYFQDRLNPLLVTVYDFQSGSGGILPSVQYRFTEALSVGVGMNFFFGKTQLTDMGVREFGPAGNRAGKDAYKNGIDNAIASFRDKDEIWLKLRWTF